LEIILDIRELIKKYGYCSLRMMSISTDHSKLAYVADLKGEETYHLFIKDLATGKVLEKETIQNVVSAEWLGKSNQDLIYTVADNALRPHKVYKHRVGTEPESDQLIFEEKDERFFLDVTRTKDQEFVSINSNSKIASEIWLMDEDRYAKPRLLKKKSKGECYLEHGGKGRFYVLTNESSTNSEFRLSVLEDFENHPGQLKDLYVPEKNVKITDIEVYRDYIAIIEKNEKGLPQIRIYSLSSGKHEVMDLPTSVCTITSTGNKDYHSNAFFFSLSSPVMPPTTYICNMQARTWHPVLTLSAVVSNFDFDKYVIERKMIPSSDPNVKIPLTLIHEKRLKLNGHNPTLITGYAAYGVSTEPSFKPELLTLLNAGWVIALCHARGGEELGITWHESGKLLNKKNSFSDLISSCEYLINEKYTSNHLLSGKGVSAGGLLFAAVCNERTDLFNSLILRVPFVDVLTSMMDPSLPLTVHEYDEWGNPSEDEKVFEYIRSYCPYQNIKDQTYPTMMVTGTMIDLRVPFWHPLKYVTKLRKMAKNVEKTVLKFSEDEGHFGDPGRTSKIETIASEYAFLIASLKK